jgi:hypothetical protein
MKFNFKKRDEKIADALNECFESMALKGESLDSCLLRYGEYAKELKPLLETMKAARNAGSVILDASFRAKARREFRSALYDYGSGTARPVFSLRWATVAASLGVFLLTSAGGAVAASSGSMPGQFLYQVKRGVEDAQLALTPSQAGKARLYASLADRRVSEIVYSAESGNVQLTESLTAQFTSDLGMIYDITAAERAANYSGDSALVAPSVAGSAPEQNVTAAGTTLPGSKGTIPASTTPARTSTVTLTTAASAPVTTATPPVVINQTSPPAPTISLSPLPPATEPAGSPVPAPVITITQPSYSSSQSSGSLSGITDPVLLKLLQEYSVKNISELMAILDHVPPSTKAALLAALQAATSAYGQILGN